LAEELVDTLIKIRHSPAAEADFFHS